MCILRNIIIIITLSILLIIGLPTIILGCTDFLCPLQQRFISVVQSSNYVESTCTDTICISYENGGICDNYMTSTRDCSYWLTEVNNTKGLCKIFGYYDIGKTIEIYVNRIDHTCNQDIKSMGRITYVGIVFIILSGITLIVLIISIIMNKSNTKIFDITIY